jgi:hypothetical protein
MVESVPSRPTCYYLSLKADAGSVPRSATTHKGSDNLRALFLCAHPRVARGSGRLGCGWPSPETPEIGHFLGQSSLFSLFGLRVGADAGLANSTTYARRFIVNQGDRSSLEQNRVVAQAHILLYHEASR